MKRASILFFILVVLSLSLSAQKSISIDFDIPLDTIQNILGGNRFWENTVELLHKEGIEEIRIHDYHDAGDYCFYSNFWNTDDNGDFTEINPDFSPENPLDYDWTSTDDAIDEIISNDFNVFFRIGVSYPNPSIPPMAPYVPPSNSSSEPLNFSNFASLSKHTLMHYNHLWDNGYSYGIKYWEIWNEPGGAFWFGSPIQYYKMFQAVSDSMKNYDDSILVGGPGAVPTTTIGAQTDFRENFIQYCSNNNVDLDFYSWHIYGIENPYGVKVFADSIRALLDMNGYENAQSIVSEINFELATGLDSLKDSSYGAAHYLSTVLTMHEAGVDKLLWYPSACHVMHFNGDTISSRSYYAMLALELMQTNTPIRVQSLGNEVVHEHWDIDTTNLMVFAAKSVVEDKLYILISNLNSQHSSFNIDITNLPWSTSDNIRIIKNEITDSERFTQTETIVDGHQTISLYAENYSSPSILFYRIEKAIMSDISDVQENCLMFTNPVKDKIAFTKIPEIYKYIELYDVSGKLMMLNVFENNIDVSSFVPGFYLMVLRDDNGNKLKSVKFQKI